MAEDKKNNMDEPAKPYIDPPKELFYSKELTEPELVYYVIIVMLSYTKGYCFMSNRNLGAIRGKSIRTMQRIIDGLRTKGYVQVKVYVDDEGNSHRNIIPTKHVKLVMGHVKFDVGGVMSDVGGMTDLSPTPCQNWQHNNNKMNNSKMNKSANADLRNSTPSQQSKAKRKKFVPPSLDEVKQYVAEKGLAIDARRFFDFYTEGEWHDGGGKPVKNWKQKALTWDRREQETRKSKPPAQGPVRLTQADIERRDAEQRKQIDDATARYRQKKLAEMQKGATTA
ncbi:helix-turn-helix domain-containing protein [uncultured Mitsuokella sp.]|uniref:helix-turn-helix domain-containing protein n=1 Tax=uncultured Mitsuokella sp. TaxID=453120 RepID=UPI0026DCA452|nr:helix-turn-helix domain-containing protein [uncultured Mitsuokella sp.]